MLNQLCVTNTFFRHRAARKLTWRKPGSARRPHCLDYVLVRRRWLSSVRNVRVRGGASPGWAFSDHQLLTACIKLRLKPPCRGAARQVCPDWSALQQPQVRLAFTAAVDAGLQAAPCALPAASPSSSGDSGDSGGGGDGSDSNVSGGSGPPHAADPAATGAEWAVLTAAAAHAATATLPQAAGLPALRPHKPHISAATLQLVAERRAVLADAMRQGRSMRSPRLRHTLVALRHRITRSIRRDRAQQHSCSS